MKRKAFSLPELIVMLVIMGILAVVSFVALDPYRGIKLDAGAKKVAADLQYIRNLALSTAKWSGISFEVDPVNTYTAYETDGSTYTPIENPAKLGTNFVVDIHNYYSGIKIDSVDIDGGSKVEFHPLGRPYNDRTGSPIATQATITLEYRGINRSCDVNHVVLYWI